MKELTEKEQENLNKLILSFMNNRNIKIPKEISFPEEHSYFEILQDIEDYMELIRNNWGRKMLDKKRLHEVEMELIYLCDNFIKQNEDIAEIKETIINKFTDLMSEVEKWEEKLI